MKTESSDYEDYEPAMGIAMQAGHRPLGQPGVNKIMKHVPLKRRVNIIWVYNALVVGLLGGQ